MEDLFIECTYSIGSIFFEDLFIVVSMDANVELHHKPAQELARSIAVIMIMVSSFFFFFFEKKRKRDYPNGSFFLVNRTHR